MTNLGSELEFANAIREAARKAFLSLFLEHPGHYYYCSLVTTGEAHAPVVSAWSEEALSVAAARKAVAQEGRLLVKWSYADSPYYCFGDEYFDLVKGLFRQRPRLTPDLSDRDWAAEYQLRLDAMERAMSMLDSEGIFGVGEARLGTVILVEVVPPDKTNTDRARRLNPPEALGAWLAEAAEE